MITERLLGYILINTEGGFVKHFVAATAALLLLCLVPGFAAETPFLYKAAWVRAAPGRLLELIELCKNHWTTYDAAGDERPLWFRHSQGDQWDLMFLFPVGTYSDYYTRAPRRAKAEAAQPDFVRNFDSCVSWREDQYVLGPPLETVKKAFIGAGYYHIEIFVSLPGKQAELRKEREMENAYSKGIGRPETLIFTRDQGADWDLFTLGFYRDAAHWAESYGVPKDKRDSAARAAGFTDSDQIGAYMRTLILMHRDTLGTPIR
jgi:hypothetical protein